MRNFLLLALLAVGICIRARADVTIDAQPQNPIAGGGPIPIGDSFTLSVRASGKGPLSYQWRRNGANIPGETNAVLQFNKFIFTDGGSFSVAVTDLNDTVGSVPVLLVPSVRRLPLVDNFPPNVDSALPGDNGNGVSSNANATVQRAAGEPFHAGEPGGASVWVEWRPTQTGIAELATLGSDFDTLLAVYVAGQTLDLPSLIPVASNDELGLYHTSGVQFNVVANQIYYIAVDGNGAATKIGGRGDIVLGWSLVPTTFLLPVFNFQPPDANHALGEDFALTVDFTPPRGSQSNTVQWFRNGVPIAGATSPQLSFKSLSPKEVGHHFARITSTLKDVTRIIESKPADIQIYRRKDNTDNGVLARDSYLKSLADGQASKLQVKQALPASLGHGVPLSLARGISGTQVFNTTGASSDVGEPLICGTPGGSSEWYSILCADAGTVVIDTQGSSFDTLLGAFFDTGTGEDVYDGLVEVACNNDISPSNHASRIAFKADAAKIYSLDMDGVGGSNGIVQLNYALYAPLQILAGPVSQTVNDGATVVFSLSTDGYVSGYQWLKDGNPIPGETGSTLTLTGVTPADDAGYSVMVDNEAGEGATSTAATLTVQTPPAVTGDPASQTVNQGDTASFTVTATGTPTPTYQWRKGGMTLDGQTAATLSLSGVQPIDEGSYDCVVSNIVGTATSALATLTVRVPPNVTGDPASQTVNPGDPASFTVTATGTGPLGYQWRKGGMGISGKTSATLTLASCVAGDAGSYDCVVTNLAGTATSAAATLTVRTVPSITTPPASQTIVQGNPVTFSVVAAGTGPLAYQWQRSTTNLPGATGTSYSIPSVALGDAASYRVVVTNLAGTVTSTDATLTVQAPPQVTGDPASQTVNQGDTANFTVTATGTPAPTYQWRKGGTALPGKTAATLSLASVLPADEGSYDCVVSNVVSTATSAAATLTVRVPPDVTGDPASQTVNPGDPVSFTVTATGTGPLGYQWRKGGMDISGKTSATLSIASCVAGDAGSYDCVVTNLAGTATSAAATLTVRTLPSITTPPASQTIVQGNPVTFSVVAAGTGPLAYQWQRATTNLPGATGTSYSIPSVALSDTGSYRVVVTNLAGTVTSVDATLTVQAPPHVTGDPLSQTVNQGDTASFTVTATGTPAPTYQWRKGGTALPGKTAATLSLTSVLPADEGSYDCVVSNVVSTATSAAATLTVRVPPNVTGDPSSQTVNPGDTASFTVTATGTGPLGYQWRKGGTNLVGKIAAMLSIPGAQSADAGSYDCVVSNLAGSDTSAAATLTVRTVPSITTPPASQTIVQGNPVTFSVVAAGTGPLAYQWQRAATNLPGATGTNYSIPSVALGDAGSYRVAVTNLAGTVTSTAATLTVQAPPLVTVDPASQTVNQGDTANFTVTATGTPAPTYQWRKGGMALPGKTAATLSLTSVLPADEGSYDCVVSNVVSTATSAAATLTVRVPPSITGDPASQTVNPGDPVSFTVTATGTGPLGYQWRKGGMGLSGKTSATLTLASCVAGDAGSYDCVVSNLAGTNTSAAATLTVRTVPSITTPPASQTIVQGNPVTFSVVAAGTGPLAYQWQRAATNLPGATGTNYSIPSVALSDAGSYRVVVTNLAGTVTSTAATLTVQAPPQVTGDPVSQTVNQGDTATFTVTATGTPAPTYQWRKGGTALPGKTAATLSLTNVLSADDGSYDCVVSNVVSTATSAAATLSVRVPPTITTPPASLSRVVGQSATFSVVAAGTPSLAYQWQRGTTNIPGATGTNYTIASVNVSDAGSYRVVVTNLAGTVTSVAATLSVSTAAAPSFTVFEVLPDGRLHLRLQGTPGLTYTIQSTPDFSTWTDVTSGSPADGLLDYTSPSPVSGPGLLYRALGP